MLDVMTTAPPVLDIEASGFGRDSFPIEVGYVLGNSESFCCLIRPAPEWTHWDATAEGCTASPRRRCAGTAGRRATWRGC
jgi:hypothetical protein